MCADNNRDDGLTLSFPAYFGAVPWVASNKATESPIFAPGANPRPPTFAAKASEMKSPFKFIVAITS